MWGSRFALRLVPLVALAALVVGGSASSAITHVTLAGDFQHTQGCAGDWDPACAKTDLQPANGAYQGWFSIPAGSYQYKVALNGSWDENYGANGVPGGSNISLSLPSDRSVFFSWDPASKIVVDSANQKIVVAAGSFQHLLGCDGDWAPDCLRSRLTDPDGDGVYTFATRALPVGSYETKATVGASWDENYGANGVAGGANVRFSVTSASQLTVFSWDSATHVLTVQAGHAADDNVEWDGLRFDSRSTLYKVPQGAVPAGTPTTIRFRTFHDDVTSVTLRDYSVEQAAERLVAMKRVASGVSCYQASLAAEKCDYWQATLPDAQPDVQWYRFIVRDGSSTAYYGDDTAALDGGVGATTSDVRDWSYALTVYDPSFQVPGWAKDAVVYQIFPDRFRNGDRKNDPKPGDPLYDLTATLKPWNALPEGYCRAYKTPCSEGPRGVDFFGGDLKGVRQSLDMLKGEGFNAIYLNPIFWSKSNHGYDTADYKQINPYLGDLKDFKLLVQQAHELGMHIILDGVFNHMSSDSPFFDRYHHYSTTGACESLTSTWRSWFTFTNSHVPCTSGDYAGWFNFDSIPVLNKSNPDVQSYFLTAPDSVTRYWLDQGADGWRLDVMGDPSFPDSYWKTFRQVVKATDPSALIIGELWQKDSTTLRFLAGQRADSTMNYRDRDAILGFLTTHTFDGKGLGDSGRVLSASEFLSRLVSQEEDYAKPAYFALMNLIDSHDTTRALWTLSPGEDNDPAAKAAGIADGKQRLRLASLVQYTLPGMPTVYYGDDVGVTGSDDPDNRRTYPWPQEGGKPDTSLQAHYAALGALRAATPVLRDGTLVPLAADDAAGTVAYGRKTETQAAIVVLDKGSAGATAAIPTAGFVPDGTTFRGVYGVSNAAGSTYTTANGQLQVPVAALSGLLLVTGQVDLTPPAAPAATLSGDGDGTASIAWNAVDGAASYDVFRSPVSGGGYVKVGSTTATSFGDSGLTDGVPYYYAVEAVDAAGNESDPSNEVQALPHLTIVWANLQWPPEASYTLSVYGGLTAFGQVYIPNATQLPGPTPTLQAQLGYGAAGSDPRSGWTWVDASFNVDAGNNDEYRATINPEQAGTYDYTFRYTTTAGRDWYYPANRGTLTVGPSGDTTPAAAPTNLHVTSFSPGAISLAWDDVADRYGFEVFRGSAAGGETTSLGLVTSTSFTDDTVEQGKTYWYVVRSVDTSWNRSGNSNEISQLADLRNMSITFSVTVPASTDATGKAVHIAGTLTGLGVASDWDPTLGTMTRVDATHWTITLTGKEAQNLQYKYVLGDWNYVEKDGACGEIGNRTATTAYGAAGAQTVSDTVLNWRNVAPCGN
ncbi:MAG TPA: alpha-amylase family glycosyl hydrolase [Gaiellaceae bacterium]